MKVNSWTTPELKEILRQHNEKIIQNSFKTNPEKNNDKSRRITT